MFEPLRQHLTAIHARRHDAALLRRGTSGQDRTEPAALQWVRRWKPTTAGGTELPGCACHTGRCAICN